MATHKFCTLCGRELPLESFPTNRGMADGHLGKCFECWAMFTSDKMRVLAMAERKQVEPKAELKPIEIEPIPKERITKKGCSSERTKAWYERLKADPERYEAFKAKRRVQALKAYHNLTEKQKEQARERNRRWYANNPEKARACVRRWRENNQERYKEYQREWRENNPDKVIQHRINSLEKKIAKLRAINVKKSFAN